MKTVFVECRSRTTARNRCLWAAVIAKVEGGYLCFVTRADYRTWKRQR